MKFKPGDIVVWKGDYSAVCLILNSYWKSKEYKVFVLSSSYKYRVGKTMTYYLEGGACLLNDKKL